MTTLHRVSSARRRAMTLVEMLVAVAASLLMMAAIAQAFAAIGDALSGSRAVLELDARLRTVAWRLRSDLNGATALPVPPLNPAVGEGYLEIIEGPNSDMIARNWFDVANNAWVTGSANKLELATPWPGPTSDDRILGDEDDVLLLTTRSRETPFIGRASGVGTFESTVAEVGWFLRPTPNTSNPVTYTLYRKQLLVRGYVGAAPFRGGDNAVAWPGSWAAYFESPCDVSVRRIGNVLLPNTLADLSRREARFMHNPAGLVGAAAFPGEFAGGAHQGVVPPDGVVFTATGPRQGEDVVLTNVLAFDVRVFDPGVASGDAQPGDPGFTGVGSAAGGYVDLGHGFSANAGSFRQFTGPSPSWSFVFHPTTVPPALVNDPSNVAKFAGFGDARSRLSGSLTERRIYDTWSLSYEADGLDQDGDLIVDEGTNGVDDDADGLVDESPYRYLGMVGSGTGQPTFTDPGEVETLPPYPFPLRGIEVRIRCYERSSRQIRQVTVRHTFVPH